MMDGQQKTTTSQRRFQTLKGLKNVATYGSNAKGAEEQLNAVENFIHRVIDDLCGREHDFVVLYSRIISETTTNIHELVESTKRYVIQHFGTSSPEEIAKDLNECTKLPKKLCEVVAAAVEGRKEEIGRGVVRKATNSFAEAYLADFDWSIRLALSSEKLSKMREPLLVLSLYLSHLDGTRTEHVVELTKPAFRELLNTLGKINGEIQKTKA